MKSYLPFVIYLIYLSQLLVINDYDFKAVSNKPILEKEQLQK